MKKYNPLFYLLFIMLIMGAFASMAQNGYGLKIMGAAGALFALVFLAECLAVINSKGKKDIYFLAEASCLFLLALLFTFRLLYIHFAFVEEIFAAAGLVLAGLYVKRMTDRFKEIHRKNNTLALLSVIYHLGIILFLLSLVLMPFASGWAEIGGLVAFVFLLVFAILALLRKTYLVEGDHVTAFSMIKYFRDHSVIVVSLFLLFTLYVGLNRLGILPGIYSDQYPQEYFKLVERAASGKEKAENGKYRHEIFKKQYELLLKRHKKGQ